MKNKFIQIVVNRLVAIAACAALGLALVGFQGVARAQNAPVALPPGVQDVLKMSQAGLGEDVLMAHIKNTGATYNLSADQLIYLSKAGLSQNVIKVLITGNSATPPSAAPAFVPPPVPSAAPPSVPPGNFPPAPSAPAPQFTPPSAPPVSQPGMTTSTAVSFESFHDQLAPYGTWQQVPGYGWCWRPTVAAFDGDWRPYGSGGHWIYTENGWYWESDYPWGNIVFHYGRWYRDSLGWMWVPGYDWAPAWVTWRNTDGYVGWAPLPPGAVYRAGVGLEFGGRVGVDLDFGLPWNAFVFVGYDHFWDRELHGYFLPHDRAELIFRRSVVMNGYRFDHGRFIVEGLGRERIGRFTHHEVRFESPHEIRGGRIEEHRVIRDDRLHNNSHDIGHDRLR